MNDSADSVPASPPESGADRLRRFYRTITSMKFAMVVILLIAVACILGTLFPQGHQVEEYLAAHPDAVGRMHILEVMGLTNVYAAWWFTGLLCILAASLLVCTTRRFRAMRRFSGRQRLRAAGSLITHISMLIILAGAVIRGLVGQKGRVAFREGESVAAFEMHDGSVPLPFSVRLTDFEIEYYEDEAEAATAVTASNQVPGHVLLAWKPDDHISRLPVLIAEEQTVSDGDAADAAGLQLNVVRYVPDFVVDMKSGTVTQRSEQPRNPAIRVEVKGEAIEYSQWLFAKFPNFNMHSEGSEAAAEKLPFRLFYELKQEAAKQRRIKDWRSALEIVQDGEVVLQKKIEVNDPLRFAGYTFFQSGYDPRDPTWTSLQVVKDPGIPVVYTGFLLMVIGLFIVFCIEPWLDPKS